MSTKVGTGTWIKGQDEIPQWLVYVASRYLDPGKGTFHTMIRNFNSVENSVFYFEKLSPQEVDFKLSKCGLFLQKLPKFSDVHASNVAANVSSTFFVTTRMILALCITLDNVPHELERIWTMRV